MHKNGFIGIVFFAYLIGISSNVCATDQINESLIYKGQSLALFATPLGDYFDRDHPGPEFPHTCTGEWKGYHGTWEVKEGVLYLVKLQEACPNVDSPDIYTGQIFGRKPPIKADWVSGIMSAAYDDKTLNVTFDKGALVKEEIVSGSPYVNYDSASYSLGSEGPGMAP